MKTEILILAVLLSLRLDIPPTNAGEEAAPSTEIVAVASAKKERPRARQFAHVEDKAKLEKTLEEKGDEVARRLVGPGRCKVIVNAELDPALMHITLLLDTSVNRTATENLTKVLVNALNMRVESDTMEVIHAPFAPTWKTIWCRPMFWGWLIAILISIALLAAAARFFRPRRKIIE